MLYILGIITGLLIAVLLLLLELRNTQSVVKRVENVLRKKERGFIIHFPTDEEQAQQEIMRRNDERGVPTNMSDL